MTHARSGPGQQAEAVTVEVEKQIDDILGSIEKGETSGPVPKTRPKRVKKEQKGKRRVVVTGLGAVTPLGLTVDEYWQGLVQGKSGIGPVTLCDVSDLTCKIAGEVRGFDPQNYMDFKEARRMARFSQLIVASTRMAVQDAGLNLSREEAARMGVVVGNGIGGLPEMEHGHQQLLEKGGMRLTPFFMPIILPNMAAGQISMLFGLKGFSATITTACAAATQAIGDAFEVIRRNKADVMVAGGTEAGISPTGIAGFCVMKALTTQNDEPTKASRPFDAKRDGFVPSEGAGVLILEGLDHAVRRGARIYAEVAGVGISLDAYHVTAPDSDGDGAYRAMQLAIEDAGVETTDVDYINAHGTSTPINDPIETLAIKRLFGEHAYRLAVSSTKSMIGHILGGSGAVEAIACVKTIADKIIHPTINYEYPDPDCDLDYVPNVARNKDVNVVLSNSFGFGGQNACLVFKKYEE
ncbi:MAG: beta-ketoacyl-ACP synthase II [Dehalococcoidia bacterium]|nr:MAG: beta-ketoacyl-ACP synthase II [Dehalococcoidia bacterium]